MQNQEDLSNRQIQFLSVTGFEPAGHNHGLDSRPVGIFESESCITDESGQCQVKYTAGDASGADKITASVVDTNSSMISASLELSIKVPGLVNFGTSSLWRLTGETGLHPDNHYLDETGTLGAFGLAVDFYETYNATLGLNDMSLPLGGLFDIDGAWASPHKLHRTGRSVDIDRCALVNDPGNPTLPRGLCPQGWAAVPRKEIEKICKEKNGRLINESTYHCEFK